MFLNVASLTANKKLALAVAAAASCFLLIVGTVPRLVQASLITAGSHADRDQKQSPEVEIVTVRSKGFTPAEISRPQGPFLLALDNRSDAEELSILLRRVDAIGLKQIVFRKRQSKHRETIDLPPGIYLLTEAAHPGWLCRITITAR